MVGGYKRRIPRELGACTNSVYQALFPPSPHESLGARLPSYLPPSVMYTVKGVDGRRLQATYSAKCSAKASSRTHGSGAHGTV